MKYRPGLTGSFVPRPNAAFCVLAILSLITSITLGALCCTAFAGTETGEFCPTCPDWTNLEGWLAQKDAYEKSQQIGAYAGTSDGNANDANDANNPNNPNNPNNKGSNINIEKGAALYPEQDIIAEAGSFPKGQIILDVRSPEEYRNGHIPGARNIYWKSVQSDGILDPALAENALRKAGINNTDDILICGDSDEGASFMFWALSYLGHRNLSRLDGGMDAAWSAGIKPDTYLPSVRESNYTINIVPWLLVNKSRLETYLKVDNIQVLDARDFADYGRCRLNTSIPFQPDKLYDDYKIKDVGTLRDLLDMRGLNRNSTQLVYGTPQAYDLFYGLKLMGYNVTVLEGDWWSETNWAVSNVK
jgi:thiosulfate/3-mercaptopyruvate sulfurtransferase